MMLLALAAVVAAPDTKACLHDNWLPPDEVAECRLAFGFVPELVRFRNVHLVGSYVCGEVNRPGLKHMSGYRPFAFLDKGNYVEKDGDDYLMVKDRSPRGMDLGDRIRDAMREGNTLEAEGYRIQKAKYDAEAREMLASCAEKLNSD